MESTKCKIRLFSKPDSKLELVLTSFVQTRRKYSAIYKNDQIKIKTKEQQILRAVNWKPRQQAARDWLMKLIHYSAVAAGKRRSRTQNEWIVNACLRLLTAPTWYLHLRKTCHQLFISASWLH